MKFLHVLLVVALSVATTLATAHFMATLAPKNNEANHETAYDRVLQTGVLRCGYADWPPYVFTKDPTTGQVSGILADVTKAVAAKLNLKVDWAENTGWGSYIESLRSHRIDAFCSGVWRQGERGRYIGYGLPIFFSATYPYVAMNDHRFDKDLSAINHPDIRISAMDGEQSDIIAKDSFPKANTNP
ncbi:MAG: transporter substrate-binding domain-containing protein [Alphaproteobacteria bacterium]|nr:transporter substrate-binding domain-containing protein [Alphaproteobacteria bacterium]